MGTCDQTHSPISFCELSLEADPRTYFSSFPNVSVSSLIYLNISFLHAFTREDSIDFHLVA